MRLLQKVMLCLLLGIFLPFDAMAETQPDKNLAAVVNPIIAYWTKIANEGDKFAQKKLARMYERGDKIEKDYEQAAFWYLNAAKQGDAKSQQKLGDFYEKGLGVPQDYNQAAYWYKQAALNEYYLGFAELARMYEKGKGVRPNSKRALDFYRKALQLEPSAPTWVKESIARLNEKQQCVDKAKTTLFSNEILCASREDFRLAIEKAGGKPSGKSQKYWLDKYDSVELISGSSELRVSYTKAGELALAQYIFPSYNDPHQISKIRAMVQNRYGMPDIASGRLRNGKVRYVWKMEDGVRLIVSRGWPDTTSYMSFKNPSAYKKLESEIEKLTQNKNSLVNN